jgi:hypothetical protein
MGRFQRNPSIGWVHPKSTLACPLTWGNNKSTLFKLKKKQGNCSIFRNFQCKQIENIKMQNILNMFRILRGLGVKIDNLCE